MVQLLASLLLRVALLPLFEISSTSQKQIFFWNHHFFQQLSGQVALVKQITILDRVKWNNNPHHPPPPRQNPGWSRARAKTRHLPIIDLVGGGGAGLNFPSILSKMWVKLGKPMLHFVIKVKCYLHQFLNSNKCL